MQSFPSEPDNEALQSIVEALTESGQAVSIYDAEDRLRYANETYWGMFLVGYEGPYTFADILRYGAAHGHGVRIDEGDVEALIARTLPRRRSARRKAFETDLLDGRWFWIEHTVLPNGWVMTVGTDISALKHNEKSLREAHEAALLASRTNPLTGLPKPALHARATRRGPRRGQGGRLRPVCRNHRHRSVQGRQRYSQA
jgi:hypothetical protein